MAITYDQSSALMKDAAFLGRCKVAAMKFATFIMNEAPATAAHNTRMKWAFTTTVDTDAQTAKVIPTVVMDPQVQSDGAAITDANLQTAFETAVQKLL